ncbi:MAG: hypothetical protein IJC84_02000 [Clostridia bacterium]|nr:hypothetical protein [Clostridia bacterium]
MNRLYAGFGRVDITPALGTPIDGYFHERISEGVLDPLEADALALRCGDSTVVLISFDCCVPETPVLNACRKSVSEALSIPVEAIYIHATHTHTGGDVDDPEKTENILMKEYSHAIVRRLTDAALLAVRDLKPARMGYGVGNAPGVAFVRRFIMKDGSIATNPGVNNPNIVRPVGEVDERVNVLRFDQEEGNSLVLVNVGNHPDVVGGNLFSADWPGQLRATVEKILPNSRCLFFNGAQGDINHVNVFPKGGFLNDTFNDFDDVSRGYGHARYMGRVVAGGVLQAYDKVQYVDVENITYVNRVVQAASQMPTPEEIPEAIHINDLHKAGRDAELPYQGMMLTTVVAEAGRMVALKDGPESFSLTLSAIKVGPVVFFGIPGEPFNGIGRALKETEGFEMVLPTCITNGSEGYFPMQDCYDEGGYETRSSYYKAGIAEFIIEEGKKLLNELR